MSMRRGPEKNGHDHGASAGNGREARHGALSGEMPWRAPALVTCEQVGNAGCPETGPTEILKPAGGIPWQEIFSRQERGRASVEIVSRSRISRPSLPPQWKQRSARRCSWVLCHGSPTVNEGRGVSRWQVCLCTMRRTTSRRTTCVSTSSVMSASISGHSSSPSGRSMA